MNRLLTNLTVNWQFSEIIFRRLSLNMVVEYCKKQSIQQHLLKATGTKLNKFCSFQNVKIK